jgi:hypothetical protein
MTWPGPASLALAGGLTMVFSPVLAALATSSDSSALTVATWVAVVSTGVLFGAAATRRVWNRLRWLGFLISVPIAGVTGFIALVLVIVATVPGP